MSGRNFLPSSIIFHTTPPVSRLQSCEKDHQQDRLISSYYAWIVTSQHPHNSDLNVSMSASFLTWCQNRLFWNRVQANLFDSSSYLIPVERLRYSFFSRNYSFSCFQGFWSNSCLSGLWAEFIFPFLGLCTSFFPYNKSRAFVSLSVCQLLLESFELVLKFFSLCRVISV